MATTDRRGKGIRLSDGSAVRLGLGWSPNAADYSGRPCYAGPTVTPFVGVKQPASLDVPEMSYHLEARGICLGERVPILGPIVVPQEVRCRGIREILHCVPNSIRLMYYAGYIQNVLIDACRRSALIRRSDDLVMNPARRNAVVIGMPDLVQQGCRIARHILNKADECGRLEN